MPRPTCGQCYLRVAVIITSLADWASSQGGDVPVFNEPLSTAPSTAVFYEGTDAYLQCSFTAASSVISIEWARSGGLAAPLVVGSGNNTGSRSSTSASLFHNVSASDAGTYVCTATTNGGTATRAWNVHVVTSRAIGVPTHSAVPASTPVAGPSSAGAIVATVPTATTRVISTTANARPASWVDPLIYGLGGLSAVVLGLVVVMSCVACKRTKAEAEEIFDLPPVEKPNSWADEADDVDKADGKGVYELDDNDDYDNLPAHQHPEGDDCSENSSGHGDDADHLGSELEALQAGTGSNVKPSEVNNMLQAKGEEQLAAAFAERNRAATGIPRPTRASVPEVQPSPPSEADTEAEARPTVAVPESTRMPPGVKRPSIGEDSPERHLSTGESSAHSRAPSVRSLGGGRTLALAQVFRSLEKTADLPTSTKRERVEGIKADATGSSWVHG